jgi:molybdopterin-guanine dinucleotide biosynthesis protein A
MRSLPLSGYVLAGGKSSRMGEDKALMRFRGVPLVELAVGKLRLGCAQVGILGGRPELVPFGECVPDGVSEAGPLAGIVAAFGHARQEWIFVLAVDVPVVPGAMLMAWARMVIENSRRPAAGLFLVEGRLQPLVSMLHRDMGPAVAEAFASGERRVLPVLQAAAAKAAEGPGGRVGGVLVEEVEAEAWNLPWSGTALERATKPLWFANVNTPEEFQRVERAVETSLEQLQ